MSIKIIDARTPEGKLELDVKREAEDLIDLTFLLNADPAKPGDFIKRHKHRFKYLDKMRPDHFDGRMK